jgi:hypothetical protein
LTYVTSAADSGALSKSSQPDWVCAMILIRFAISIFALALLGLAVSLSGAQSEQPTVATAMVSHR